MAADVALHHLIADRNRVVDVVQSAVARARIVVARLVIVVGQFDERDVLAQRHRFGGRRHARDGAGEESAAASTATAAATCGRSLFDALRTLRRAAATAAASTSGVVDEGERHL